MRIADGATGSRVTITSNSPLSDYSAYRSGDRFYVVIPESNAPGFRRGLKGKGYEDVQVQKRGTDTVLSFQLQPGAAARVDQKFNKLDIDISTPTIAAAGPNPVNTYPKGQGVKRSFREGRETGQATASSSGTTGVQSDAGVADSLGSAQGDGQSSPSAIGTAGSISTIENQTNSAQPSPSTASGQPGGPLTGAAGAMNYSAGIFVVHNWPWLVSAGVLLLVLLLFQVSRPRRKGLPTATTEPKLESQSSELQLEQPRSALNAGHVIESQQKVLVNGPVPLDASQGGAFGQNPPPVQETVIPPPLPAKGGTRPRDFEKADVEVRRLLAGDNYDLKVVDSADAGMRQFVATELLAAIGSRHASRRAMALNAFLKHGYFDEATLNLRVADAQAERAASARALGLVRDQAATPHLVAALDDPSPDVRRAAVEALAELKDPSAVQALEGLLQRERDGNVLRALIQRAINASLERETHISVSPLKWDEDFAVHGQLKVGEPSDSQESAASGHSRQYDVSLELLQPGKSQDDVIDLGELTEARVVSELNEAFANFADSEKIEPVEEPIDFALEFDPLESHSELLKSPLERLSGPQADAPLGELTTVAIQAAEGISGSAEKVEPLNSESSNAPVSATQPDENVNSIEPLLDAISLNDIPLVSPDELLKPFQQAMPKGVPSLGETDEPRFESVSEPASNNIDHFSISDLLRSEPHVASSEPVIRAILQADSTSTEQRQEASSQESVDPRRRAAAVESMALSQGESAFPEICEAFDDPAVEVRNAAALALYGLTQDRASSFTRALREASFERRRRIGAALATSGLAAEAIGSLAGEGRDKTYDAFSLLFLMSKAGEVEPLVRAVEEHPDQEVRLAVVRLLALSGQQEILPYFRRLAVRGSLSPEVRSAVMEAVYQISNQLGSDAHSAA